jgi:osmotically-inducible protein OsmY
MKRMNTSRHTTIAANAAAIAALALSLALVPAVVSAQAQQPDASERIPGSDTWIESRLVMAYTLNEHLNIDGIEVESEQGCVTWCGSVRSNSQKQQAAATIRQLTGVREVANPQRVEQSG